MTAAGLILGALLALMLLARELARILGIAQRGRRSRALDALLWSSAAAFAAVTAVRVLHYLT